MASSPRYQAPVEAAIGLLAVAGVVVFIPTPSLDYRMVFTFFVAIFLLELLDLRMPYGDLMPVDSSLVVACLVLAGPVTALVSATVARVAVHMAKNGTSRLGELADVLSRRLIVLFLSALLLGMARGLGLPLIALSILVGVVFVALELAIAQVQSTARLDEAFLQLLVGNLALQWPLLASQVSVVALSVLIYPGMRSWGLVLMFLLVFLMRQSLALLLEIRQAYRTTIEALVASIEIQDQRRRGHAERVESIARAIGLRLGLKGKELETLGYAALLHDVDLIGVDSEDWPAVAYMTDRHAAEIVSDVHFLRDVVPVLRICDGSSTAQAPSHVQSLTACVVEVASEADDARTTDSSLARADSMRRLSPAVDDMMVREVRGVAAALGFLSESAVVS